MTTLCLSIFEYDEPQALINHRHYCSQMGYEHEAVSYAGLQSVAHRILYKYELILHHLRRLPEDALLACLTEDCVIFGMHSIENMAEGRDHVLPGIDGEGYDRQTAVQVWRNTAAIRALITGFVARAKITTGLERELDLYAGIDYLPPYAQLAGCYCAVMCNVRRHPAWNGHANIWTLVLSDIELYAGTHPRFRAALFEHVNDWQQNGAPLLEFPAYAGVEQGGFSVQDPGRPVAIVMYYTPNIRQFGAIAESNFLRYCKRHGYTLYVHRETPAEAGPGLTGTWLKMWLLNKYLPHHEWVLWVDADILFVNQAKQLEPLLEGHDIVAAHDIGSWIINAGALGFRRTSRNLELVARIFESICAVPDKSSTYASGGDQTVVADILTNELGWNLDTGLDLVSLNTPWFFQQDSSLMVHYYGMATELRALMMAAQDRGSLRHSAADATPDAHTTQDAGHKPLTRDVLPSIEPMTDQDIIAALPVFSVNSAGTPSAVAALALKSANQSFPLLATLISELSQHELHALPVEAALTSAAAHTAAQQLKTLFDHYGSDKANPHNYHFLYGHVLREPLAVTHVLEIGMGTNNEDVVSNMSAQGRPGASLRAFRDFLPNARIFGADIDQRILFQEDRIETYFVDQTELDTMAALGRRLPAEFDLIIDDGLHTPNANLASLLIGLPKLKRGGHLVVEDIHPEHLSVWRVVAASLPSWYKPSLYAASHGYLLAIKRLG